MSEGSATPCPASSCHLRYKIDDSIDLKSKWELRCSVRVEDTANCSFFCVVGWGPGGYSGIQQVDSHRRVAIFSMWGIEGESNHGVDEVAHGDGVTVSSFGGEGTGLKAMKDVYWEVGQVVTFLVRGELWENGDMWKCSCWYVHEDDAHFMASYERSAAAGDPLNHTGFYSFIEDWDRSDNAEGHLEQRCAEFLAPSINGIGLDEAMFTKVLTGYDAFAASKATCCVGPKGFNMRTGGGEEIEEETPNGAVIKRLESTLRMRSLKR